MKNKKAAMEMTMGTIVTIVILVSVLILSLILVKNVMCGGIILTDQVVEGAENELKNLFGNTEYGVKCMGEEGDEITLGDGGKRQIICIINTDETIKYNLKLNSIESLSGASTNVVKTWVSDKNWQGSVSPGKKTVTVLLLDVPRNVDDTSLKIEIEEENKDTGNIDTHILYLNVKHLGQITSAMC